MLHQAQPAARSEGGATAPPLDVARGIYDAFGRGDVAGFFALCHPDIEWCEAEGNPYQPDGTPWHGHQPILDLFTHIAEDWDGFSLHDIRVTPMTGGVVTQCRYHGTFKATGRSMNIQVAHVLRIRDGLLTHFQQYADTAAMQWTMGVSSPQGGKEARTQAE